MGEVKKCHLYIPHGSDERAQRFFSLSGKTFLYIPHGSDERPEGTGTGSGAFRFISHMVQMKGCQGRRHDQDY